MATSGKYEIRPPVPDWLQQWQFIKYAATHMCDRPAIFYFETALPVAGEIAMELLQFDWYSFVKRIIRPKQLRSQRHGRKGRRGGRRFPGIPETSDIIAHHVDKTRKYRLPPSFNKTQFLFVIDDTIQQANHLAFLIEESTKLPYQTFVGVVKADASKCPDQGAYLRHGTSWGNTGLEPPWVGIPMGTLDYARNTNTGFPLFWGPGFGEWMVCMELEVRAATGSASGFRMRIADQNTGAVYCNLEGYDPEEGDWQKLMISGTMPAGGVAAWQTGIAVSSCEIRKQRFLALRVG